jgi:hypothetical protein
MFSLLFLSGWGWGHRAWYRLHMNLFPGSCSILLGLVSMATGSQQAARQLEGSRQAGKARRPGQHEEG